jgi:hypothetical protein
MSLETLGILLALASFVALALAIVVFYRRFGRFVAETRQVDTFRRAITDLERRAGVSIDGVAGKVDQVRRRTIEPEAIAENVSAAFDAVGRYGSEVGSLDPPHDGRSIRDGIATELERAGRALALVEHGCSILSSARPGSRELEAQTSIKRGYLNLVHAREAIARLAAEASALEGPDPAIRVRRT